MKLSHLTLGALLLVASASYGQQDPKKSTSKGSVTDTTKIQPTPKETSRINPPKRDSSKIKTTLSKKRYCPGCGMG